MDLEALTEGVLSGNPRAISRAISAAEDRSPQAFELLKRLFPRTGKAHVVGITGPPGAGKSTLTARLLKLQRDAGKSIGVIAVDPTSPFSGGAILGDRVRMAEHFLDPEVYIRSMATRGTLGGVSSATYDAVTVLEASGKDLVIIETVGVGQDEIDIVNTAHTSVVVLVPGMGDEVQAIKAGILEIGDLFVINKADRPGVNRLETELQMMLDLAPQGDSRRPPIIRTTATEGEGVGELAAAIEEHRAFLAGSEIGLQKEVMRCRHRILGLWKDLAMETVFPDLLGEEELRRASERMARREAEPYSFVEALGARLRNG